MVHYCPFFTIVSINYNIVFTLHRLTYGIIVSVRCKCSYTIKVSVEYKSACTVQYCYNYTILSVRYNTVRTVQYLTYCPYNTLMYLRYYIFLTFNSVRSVQQIFVDVIVDLRNNIVLSLSSTELCPSVKMNVHLNIFRMLHYCPQGTILSIRHNTVLSTQLCPYDTKLFPRYKTVPTVKYFLGV